MSDESSPSLPADSCTTSVLFGGFTLHLDGETQPRPPPPLHHSTPPPASSPSPSPPRSRFQQPGAPTSGDPVDEGEGRDGIARFFYGLQHLSRGSGGATAGWGGGWGSSGVGGGRGSHGGMPWPQHPRAFLRGLRQGKASLSSFLGFSGSGSDLSDAGAEDVDRANSCSRRTSNSSAVADGFTGAENAHGRRITEATSAGGGKGGRHVIDGAGGVGSESIGDGPSDKNGADGPQMQDGCVWKATAAGGSLAVLTIGEISLEVGRTLPLRSRRRVALLSCCSSLQVSIN